MNFPVTFPLFSILHNSFMRYRITRKYGLTMRGCASDVQVPFEPPALCPSLVAAAWNSAIMNQHEKNMEAR